MRICRHETCDEAAVVYWHGAWCAKHAGETFGAVVGFLSKIETRDVLGNYPPRRGGTASSEAIPSSGEGDAPAEPSPTLPTVDELEAIFAEDYSGGPGLVEA